MEPLTALEALRKIQQKMGNVVEIYEGGDGLVIQLQLPRPMKGITHGNTLYGQIVEASMSYSPASIGIHPGVGELNLRIIIDEQHR